MDPCRPGRGDVDHITCPFTPIDLGAALAYDLGRDGFRQFTQIIEPELVPLRRRLVISIIILRTWLPLFRIADSIIGLFLLAVGDAALVEHFDLDDMAQCLRCHPRRPR